MRDKLKAICGSADLPGVGRFGSCWKIAAKDFPVAAQAAPMTFLVQTPARLAGCRVGSPGRHGRTAAPSRAAAPGADRWSVLVDLLHQAELLAGGRAAARGRAVGPGADQRSVLAELLQAAEPMALPAVAVLPVVELVTGGRVAAPGRAVARGRTDRPCPRGRTAAPGRTAGLAGGGAAGGRTAGRRSRCCPRWPRLQSSWWPCVQSSWWAWRGSAVGAD